MSRLLPAAVAILVTAAPAADADVLLLYANAHGGGMFGTGTGGAQKDAAFFKNAPNGEYGLSVTGRFLFLAGEISHDQYRFFGGEPAGGLRTWTQFSAGLDFDVDLGSDKQKKAHQGKFLQASALAGFGLGTGQQVVLPLDNSQVSDKGFMLGGRIGLGSHVSKLVDFGLLVPVQYGYFFKKGVANDLSNHYQGVHAEALLFLRLNLKLL